MNLSFWIVTLIPALFVLWVFFVNIMWLKHVGQKRYTTGWKKVVFYMIGYPFAFAGFIWDIIFNITYGTLMFLQLPELRRLTLSARMSNIIVTEDKDSWRWKLAWWICHKLVEPWDRNHCGLIDFFEEKRSDG